MLLLYTCRQTAWASYQIRKIAGCACAGNAGNVFPRRRFLREPLVSDPGMHHGTCLTHVPWCMPGSLTCGDGENVPGIPGACASAILRIWQEAHDQHIQTPSTLISLNHKLSIMSSWLHYIIHFLGQTLLLSNIFFETKNTTTDFWLPTW